ncbi:MAG: MarR family winged helix-turn-helix transcriptional regulator [Spirosomataceae bacterium]
MKPEQIEKIRDFNRFYTKVIGVLDKTYLNSPYSLVEVRVLREISLQPSITANEIMATLGLDKGYLSRILKAFERKQLISKTQCTQDGRAFLLTLTEAGKTEVQSLDAKASRQVAEAFANLDLADYDQLLQSMQQIKAILQKHKP